jgi:putative endonuclease
MRCHRGDGNREDLKSTEIGKKTFARELRLIRQTPTKKRDHLVTPPRESKEKRTPQKLKPTFQSLGIETEPLAPQAPQPNSLEAKHFSPLKQAESRHQLPEPALPTEPLHPSLHALLSSPLGKQHTQASQKATKLKAKKAAQKKLKKAPKEAQASGGPLPQAPQPKKAKAASTTAPKKAAIQKKPPTSKKKPLPPNSPLGYYTYILACADETLYTGWTKDLEKRLKTHNQGKGAKYTAARLPVSYVAVWTFLSQSEAMRWEIFLKRLPRSQKLHMIAQQGLGQEEETPPT